MVHVAPAAVRRKERGFSLIETVIAIGILGVGVLGAAGVLSDVLEDVADAPLQPATAPAVTSTTTALPSDCEIVITPSC